MIHLEMWAEAAKHIDWVVPPKAVLTKDETSQHPNPYVWFPGGQLNTCYNCVDRHDPSATALIWDSTVTGAKKTWTYGEVRRQVVLLAGLLNDYGVGKGDTVVIYMPMVPEAVFAMLACARLGAVHSCVFGGFAPPELAKRIDDCHPKVIITASCGIEPKRVIPYKPLVEAALGIAHHSIPYKLVLQRPGQLQADLDPTAGDRDYETEMARIDRDSLGFESCVSVQSEDPLYILYTSGTTGVPKGVVRTNGGHAVALRWTMDYIFQVKKGQVMFTASDIGWAVAHSYTVYGPFLAGVTTILFEGKPVMTPDASVFWRIVDEYNVKTMFTAPTAVRAIRRADPEALLAKPYDLSRLQALFLAGERSDPDTLAWCKQVVKDSHVIDHYWSTELGSPITATCLGAETVDPIKWGSAGKAVPGSDVCVLLEETKQEATEPNTFGHLVLRLPLAPSGFPSLWKNDSGYIASYFTRFPGYFDTGDAGIIDEQGYVHVMARTDDVINVAGHRLSTGSIEQIIIAHPLVAECCVVPMPDALKGHVPLAAVVLKNDDTIDTVQLTKELVAATRRDLGAIACFQKAVYVPRLPKTRSGKTLRRCVRDMVEGKELKVPATIEDDTVLPEIESILRMEGLLAVRT